MDALRRKVIQNNLRDLPGQAGTVAEKQMALDALKAAGAHNIQSRTEDLLTPQIGTDLKGLFKSYAEPAIGAYLGSKLGGDEHGALGGSMGMLGGLLMGRTRAGKAIQTRLARPGNQMAIYGGLMRALGHAPGIGNAVEHAAAPEVVSVAKSATDNFAKAFPGIRGALAMNDEGGQ